MNDQFPIIKTERLLLRQFTMADQENVFNGLSDPKVIKYYGIHCKSLEGTKEQLRWFADLERNGTGIWWAICSLNDGTFYGAGGLSDLSKKHQKAEIGFWLLPDYWSKGIMQEVMPLICKYAFKTLGLHRIEGFVESLNLNCKRALTRLNFRHEGTMQDCEIKNGQFISLDIYAKIDEDNGSFKN